MTEAAHHVALTFRQKDKCLRMEAYETRTNMGLLQANQSRMQSQNQSYHWYIEVFRKLNLPVTDGILLSVQKANKNRQYHLKKKSSEEGRRRRVTLKITRVERQEARKAWVRAQPIQHDYGSDSTDIEAEQEVPRQAPEDSEALNLPASAKKGCKCGSSTHRRISSRECPLNKENQKK